jgi:MFS family permease
MSWRRPSEEGRWAIGVGAAAAAIFLLTFSPHASLGDSPESVAGIASVGILHAPGYPAYVLAGRLFTLLEPFGSLAFRVNLFSTVCAVLAVVGVRRLARILGASQVGAAVGALALATATSFWFYAGFAKHYTFSALLLVVAALLVLEWRRRESRGLHLLAGAGAVLGLTTGAAWQLAALAVPGLAVLVLVLPRRQWPRPTTLAAPMLAGLVVAGAVWAFVPIRAAQEPAINWGEASTSQRLTDLFTMKDFGFGTDVVGRSETSKGKAIRSRDAFRLPLRMLAYGILLSREFGYLVLALAATGIVAAWRRRPRAYAAFLTLGMLTNLVAAALVVPPGRIKGFSTGLSQGGFLLGALVTVAVASALGVTAVERVLTGAAAAAATKRKQEGRSRAERRRNQRKGRNRPQGFDVSPAVAGAVLAALALLPSLAIHLRPASHRGPAYADDYATNVLASVPRHGVLVLWGTEQTFPFLHRQVAEGDRRDVLVVNGKGLSRPWYQEQLARKLGRPNLHLQGSPTQQAAEFVKATYKERPVYLDTGTAYAMLSRLAFRPKGLVFETVDGIGPKFKGRDRPTGPAPDLAWQVHGLYDDPKRLYFPNVNVVSNYLGAHLGMGQISEQLGDREEAKRHYQAALRIDPKNETARKALAALAAKPQT